MKNRTLVVIVFVSWCFVQAVPQAGKPPATSSGPVLGQLGSAEVWRSDNSFPGAAQAACGTKQGSEALQCVTTQMTRGGASPEAVRFTQELYESTKQIGIMEEVKAFPPVSLAWVVYPLRTGDVNGLLIVNGEPPFVNPDDVAKLDKAALQKDTNFQNWQKTNPKLDVYPGDRAGGVAQVQFARVWPGSKPGEQKFLFSYPLRDGCATCDRVAFANYFWKFDANGKFLGTELLSVTRGVPPVRKHTPIPPPAANPTAAAPAPH